MYKMFLLDMEFPLNLILIKNGQQIFFYFKYPFLCLWQSWIAVHGISVEKTSLDHH